jgi:WD40 repeat protein
VGIADAGIGQLEAVAFSPDGRGLAVGGQHGAELWSIAGTAGPTRQRTLDGGATAVTSLAYSQGGRRLLLSSDGTGQTWDVANPSQPVTANRQPSGTSPTPRNRCS